MTRLEIEVSFQGRSRVVLSLSGSLHRNHLIKLLMLSQSAQGLGLRVTLNLSPLRFAECEALKDIFGWRDLGIQIMGCPPYIQEWFRNDAQEPRTPVRLSPDKGGCSCAVSALSNADSPSPGHASPGHPHEVGS